MPDNVLQTLQLLVQDVLAPDVRELKVRASSLEEKMDLRFHALEREMDTRFLALEQKMDSQFSALMSAISESRVQAELATLRMLSALGERVAVLESRARHA